MVFSHHESVLRNEIKEKYARIQRNIDGLGSEEKLKELYPIQYKKLMKEIHTLEQQYLEFCFRGLVNCTLPTDEFYKLFSPIAKSIKADFRNREIDLVQNKIEEFIIFLMVNYEARAIIEPDEHDFPYDPEYEEYKRQQKASIYETKLAV